MKYQTDINEGAFNAILAGSKTVEIRTNTAHDPIDYLRIRPGDVLEFDTWPSPSGRKMLVAVKAIRHYSDARSLFEAEGLKNTTSSEPKDIQTAVASIHSLTDYEQAIRQHGVFALELEKPALIAV